MDKDQLNAIDKAIKNGTWKIAGEVYKRTLPKYTRDALSLPNLVLPSTLKKEEYNGQ
jgi:hypothetical protein|tara:strand:- start:329 stop:499 length:171 start_codon:yes stop_codon:yes gene_type:complete